MSHQRTGVVVAAIAMGNARNPLDMAWHQRFSGVAEATRAVAEHRGKLDPDGCLVRFSSQPTERENGCASESVRMKMVALHERNQLRGVSVALDNGPANGCRLRAK